MALSPWIRSWKRSVERRWALYQIFQRKAVTRRRAARPCLEALEERWLLSIYTVTSAADDGSAGTLRYAINQANAPGSTITEIDFNIGTPGSAQTISPTSQLPTLTANGVFINGLSQGGNGNTKQLITLDGTNAGSSSDGLLLQGSKDIVSGLIIENFKNGIEVDGFNDIIGGTATGAGNIISGNTIDGVLIDNDVSGVQVLGNYIGTDATGAKAVANSVGVEADGYASTIGGTASAARNLISGNSSAGVLIKHEGNITTGTLVLGNYIGTNAAGNAALANQIGIQIYSGSNTIGGSTSGAGNLISGNSSAGMLISGAGNSNLVLGNSIGTDAAGAAALPNAGGGLEIDSSNNTVGGTAPGSGNLISGNSSDGLDIGPGTGNLVLGNSIGTNVAGTAALPNAGVGFGIDGGNNTIGGAASGAGNLISGNSYEGVILSGTDNLVLGNSIGTNIAGNAALPNKGGGIEISLSGNTVGGTASGARNLISGNGSDGVHIGGGGSEVLGNYIGTNVAGNAALPNAGSGIYIGQGNSTIGGTASGAGNLISGNSKDGVVIAFFASGVQLLGNSIGTNAAGNAAVPNSIGILVEGTSNTIGGTTAAARNLISGNLGNGVQLEGEAAVNDFQGNYIGTDVTGTKAVANSIGVDVDASNITFGSTASGALNIISGNSAVGVLIGATGVTVQGNYIGINAAGNAALANSIGVKVLGSTLPNQVAGGNDTIGGATSGALNVISGNTTDGVLIDKNVSGVVVQGNYIGTNAAGNAALANSVGVEVSGNNNSIGGTTSGSRNVISGNSADGVRIDKGVSGVAVQGNYIGTNATGNAALANFNGIEGVDISYSTIGGTVSAARNIISGNRSDAVGIDGSTGNQVLGNYIGTNAAGNAAIANGNGLSFAFAISNTVGGTVSGAVNLISGNTSDGVSFDFSTGNQVLGNYIGTNAAGNAAIANGNGLSFNNAIGNTVGGTVSGASNLISGNTNGGVSIDNSTGNQVLGNSIGTNAAGNAVIANGTGIGLIGSDNTIGGTASGARNLISGNTSTGMDIGGSSNQVLGNYIGTNAAGNAALANGDGIFVSGSNTVGGTVSGAANLISGNGNAGVYIVGSGVQVLGNSIGTNAAGDAPLANYDGIFVFDYSATIGGTVSGASNLISGNSFDGVDLESSGNQVLGNRIGTNIAGNAALANGYGIEVGGSSNMVGGTVSGASNLISGNSGYGVRIRYGASGNQVLGNSIGTNAAGYGALANSVGIEVIGSYNTIGGTISGARNIISGNTADGVLIDSGASGVAVQGNYIGTDVTGSKAVANSVGVEVDGSNNTIGGTVSGARNVISGNSQDGVLIDSRASGVAVQGNSIGTDVSGAALGNGHYGVNISGNNNLIGGSVASAGNIIADNTQGGVLVSAGSGDTIRLNSIFANGSTNTGPGITLSNGANNNLAAPTLHFATFRGGTLRVHGSFMAPTAKVSYVLDFYANPSGDAEGRIYLGSLTVTPNHTGTQSFTFTTTTTAAGRYPLITATLTDATGDTSSFSNGVTVNSPPSPSPSLALNMPPLLAFSNSLFGGGIETVNGNGTETITDYFFGIPLLVSTFNSSGQLMSVSLLGIDIAFLFG